MKMNLYDGKKQIITFLERQNEKEITTGDLLKIGDSEEFYVVSSDEQQTVLLARYNLLVGNIYNSNWSLDKAIDVTDDGYGRQSSLAKGVDRTGILDKFVGTLAFSEEGYWLGKVGENKPYEGIVSYSGFNSESYEAPYPYVYDENSNLYTYLNYYKEILENEGAAISEARLLTYNEIITLGCAGPDEYTCQSAPSWVYNTSYWLGASYDNANMMAVFSDSYFGYGSLQGTDSFGVRPVIVISTSDITI